MKRRIFQFSMMLLLGMGVSTFYGCGDGQQQAEQVENNTETASKSRYMCPMECEGSNLEEAGTCPVCGMDLVLRSEWEKVQNEERGASHDHDHGDHEGHDHGDHEGHDHGEHEGHDHGDHEGHSH